MGKKSKKQQDKGNKRSCKKAKKILSMVSSIIVTVTGIVISIVGLKYNSYQNSLYEKEIFPHFNIVEVLGERVEENKYVDYELHVFNSGGNFYKLSSRSVTFLEINNDYIMPLGYFYSFTQRIYSLENDRVLLLSGYDNNKLLSSLNEDRRNNYEEYYSLITHTTYIKIDYQDVYGDFKTQYFNASSGELLDNFLGERIFELHDSTLNNLAYMDDCAITGINIDTVSMEVIEEYLNSEYAITTDKLFKR